MDLPDALSEFVPKFETLFLNVTKLDFYQIYFHSHHLYFFGSA